jgi:hypothetical protein
VELVVEFQHTPECCPHSNAMVRKAFEDAVQGGGFEDCVQIHVIETFTEFADEIEGSKPIF